MLQRLEAEIRPAEKLPFDTEWVNIRGLRITAAPERALFRIKGGAITHPFIPQVHLARKVAGYDDEERQISAQRLLPPEIRHLYGLAPPDISRRLDCHTAAILFNYPQILAALPPEPHLKWILTFLHNHYRYLDPSEPLIIGDHLSYVFYWQNPDNGNLLAIRRHSAVWIAPGLVFSRNGKGPAVPFYLQEEKWVEHLYGAPAPCATRVSVDHWRPNRVRP